MNRIQPIKVFGSEAEAIREGEIFSSSVGSVEGRTVVTLNHLGHLEGKTVLHIGKNNTFNQIADAILEKVTATEAKILLMAIEKHSTEPKFLKQEAELQKLFAKIKKEKELKH